VRENCTHGSEGGEAQAFSTPIGTIHDLRSLAKPNRWVLFLRDCLRQKFALLDLGEAGFRGHLLYRRNPKTHRNCSTLHETHLADYCLNRDGSSTEVRDKYRLASHPNRSDWACPSVNTIARLADPLPGTDAAPVFWGRPRCLLGPVHPCQVPAQMAS